MTVHEFKAFCSKHELPVRGKKVELFKRVTIHFRQLYMN